MSEPSVEQLLERDTAALAMPEGRRVGQPGHEVAKAYLIDRLTEMGLPFFEEDSFELPFSGAHPKTGEPLNFTNLAGLIRGRNPDLEPVLIGAHYDSVIDAPCADDNATAVAVVLAAAQHFLENQPERDIVIAIFDSEEPPFFRSALMGSTRFYQDHCVGKIRFACAIIMDLIGHDTELPGLGRLSAFIPGIKNLLFVQGTESHPAFPEVVETTAEWNRQLRILPTLTKYVGAMSDHHAFREGGEPFLFLSCGIGRFYHHPKDDLDWISLKQVRRVYDYVISLVERLDRTEIDRSEPKSDPADFEIRMVKKALGFKLGIFRFLKGFRTLKTRKDLDAMAKALGGRTR